MKFMQTEKKQLLIYVIIAYGITYVMGLLMWYGYGKGLDLSAFPNAQMLYPAAGVMMAYLITKKGDKNLPTAFYIFFVALTAVLVVCTAASVLAPQNRDLMSMPYSQWAPIMNYVIIGGSVIFWILLLQSGKEKRRSYGLNSEHWNISIRMILLFIGLYLLRFVIACALSGQLSEFGKIMANPTTWIIFFTVLVNFFLSVLAFFGEEHREALNLCGRVSGRDEDKIKEAGLTPYYVDGTVAFEEAKMIFVCKKVYVQRMGEEHFVEKANLDKWYADKDMHNMYMGEIKKILVKED